MYKNIIANYVGQFYSIFIGLIILPFYLEYLGAEAYGLVGFFTMLMSWMMLLDIGLTATLSREIARLKSTKEGLFKLKILLRSIEFIFIFVSSIVVYILYTKSMYIVEYWLNIHVLSYSVVEKCIQIMSIMLVFRWFTSFYLGAIVGFEQQVWLNIYKITINTVRYLGAFLLMKYYTSDIIVFFIYQLIVGIFEYIVIQFKVYTILPKTKLILPSLVALKNIAPFALKVAFTSGIWIFITQIDKLLLSHYLPLTEYGYFTLVVIISNAIMQISIPVSQALLPRMTSLIANDKIKEMVYLYHMGTKFVAIVIISIATIIYLFSFQLLYIWTGDIDAATWASPVLIWYVLANTILSIATFQYYLQVAYGNLTYHVKMNIIFPFIVLPSIAFGVIQYGAFGSAIVWFIIQLLNFMFWVPFIHSKFLKGEHLKWVKKDILPSILFSLFFLIFINYLKINFNENSRIEVFIYIMFLGIILLLSNLFLYKDIRKIIVNKLLWRKNNERI